MKKIILAMLLLTVYLFAAQIDTKLFDGADREAYYKEIKKSMNKSELHYLSRLEDAASQEVQIDKYAFKTLSNPQNYYTAVSATATVHYKEIQSKKLLDLIQSKLLFLKKAINEITETDKKNLLSYQLQFAYYKIQQKNINTKLELLQKYEDEIKAMLVKSLASLECTQESDYISKLNTYDKTLQEIAKEKIAQQLLEEKALIEDSGNSQTIAQKMDAVDTKHEEVVGKKIALKLEYSACYMQEKKSSDFYKLLKNVEANLSDVSSNEQKTLFSMQIEILRDISQVKFGTTKLFFGATFQESKDLLLSFKNFFTSSLFVFNEHSITLLSLFKAILLISFGFFIGAMYKRWIIRVSNRWQDLSMMSVRLASNIGYYLIIFIFLIIAASSLGIDMSSISLIAGALSIGIGFGLQTVVSNLVAGIILMFERTIRIGDTIEISDILFGTVTDMRIRSTTIKTFDNIDIVVPNSSFIQNNVINWTLEDKVRRLHIPFGVAYDTEVEDVKKAVLGALEESSLMYIQNDENKKPDIRMVQMNNSSVDFELIVWIVWNPTPRGMSLKSDFLILIYNALRANNITIPFPQLDIYMKQMPNQIKENN